LLLCTLVRNGTSNGTNPKLKSQPSSTFICKAEQRELQWDPGGLEIRVMHFHFQNGFMSTVIINNDGAENR
jgi:hypothetical protein